MRRTLKLKNENNIRHTRAVNNSRRSQYTAQQHISSNVSSTVAHLWLDGKGMNGL